MATNANSSWAIVAPLAGAWIEIETKRFLEKPKKPVAPLAGAWIEIYSLPAGIKRRQVGRTPRGCVD